MLFIHGIAVLGRYPLKQQSGSDRMKISDVMSRDMVTATPDMELKDRKAFDEKTGRIANANPEMPKPRQSEEI